MRNIPRRILAIVVLCAIAAPPQCNAADYPEHLWQTFRDRQVAAENVSVTWEREVIHAAIGSEYSAPGQPAVEEDIVQPPHKCRLLLSGARGRLESQNIGFDEKGKTTLTASTYTFDGIKEYTMSHDPDQPWGVIQDSDDFQERRMSSLQGLFYNVRPLESWGIGPDPSAWTMEDRPAVVDGHECVVLTKPVTSALDPSVKQGFSRLYVDRDGDLLRRFAFVSRSTGEVTGSVDMQYDVDRDPPWIPSSWTWHDRHAGQSTNHVEEVELGLEIPDERFRIEFPKGTYVSILSSREEARKTGKPVSEQFMIAGDDGVLLPRRTEIAERTQIANESTIATPTSRWPLLLAAIGAAALGVALLLWRRYARTAG